MEKQLQEMVLVGYHHFNSKDKTQIYYVVQCLYSDKDITRGNAKGTMINIFVEDELYKKICNLEIGSVLQIEISPNINTGKINYRIVI